MKKIFIVLAVAVLMMAQVSAQDPSFSKGDKVMDIGIGLPYLRGYKMVVPPIIASFEMGIVDGIFEKAAIGVGGYVGFSSNKYLTYSFSNLSFGVRATFHYPLVDNLDTYAGILTGYTLSFPSDAYNASRFDIGTFVGARYYFSNTFAVMAEVGYGISILQIGVSMKF